MGANLGGDQEYLVILINGLCMYVCIVYECVLKSQCGTLGTDLLSENESL